MIRDQGEILDIHERFMLRAAELAKKGTGFVNPNPLVGAVIVKNGKICGEGWHEKYGAPHAEINALASCKDPPAGASLYVTLEPCCHYGKTPPCTDAIIKSGIKKVFIGSSDPNPAVSGKGIEILREKGIEVSTDILSSECRKLNEIFFYYITTGMPFVILKSAVTADGKITPGAGFPKQITGAVSIRNVHETRKKCAAIMVGIGTVLEDDPMLNCRYAEDPHQPVRIVCDSKLRLPATCRLVKTAKDIPVYAATLSDDAEKIKILENSGVKIIRGKESNGRIDLRDLAEQLGKMDIDSILIEGGPEMNRSALESGIVSKIQIYIAPEIFGNRNLKTAVGGDKTKIFKLSRPEITLLGDDVLLEYMPAGNRSYIFQEKQICSRG